MFSTPDGHIDSYRDNWWCALKEPENAKPPAFLTAAQQKSGAAEREAIIKAAGAPAFFASTVVAWARSHPADPRLPEALALAVKTSHFGCTDASSAKPVEQAFSLLHRRFPNSTWAKQTPYWY
jgi:hypothetical protein